MIPFEVVHESTPSEPPPSTTVSIEEDLSVKRCTAPMVVIPAIGSFITTLAWYNTNSIQNWSGVVAALIILSWAATAAVSSQIWRSWLTEEGILSGRALLLTALVVGVVANLLSLSSSTLAWLSSPLSSVIVWAFFIHLSLYFADILRAKGIASSSLWPSRSLEKRGDKVDLGQGQILPFDAVVMEGMCEVLENRFGGGAGFAVKRQGDEIPSGSRIIVGNVKVAVTGIGDEQENAPYVEAFEFSLKEGGEDAPHTRRLKRSMIVMFILFCGALLGVWLSDIGAAVTLERVALVFSLGFLLEVESLYRVIRRSFFATLFKKGSLFKSPDEALKFLGKVKTILLDPPPSALTSNIRRVLLVDDRVDEDSLYSTIYCVLGGVQNRLLRDLGAFARGKIEKPKLLSVEGIEESESGVVARVEGAPFVVGDEEFLIDHGVHLDLSSDSPPQIFVAIGGAIVATCDLSPKFEDQGSAFVNEMSSLGITTHLLGTLPQGELDELGKRAGVELARVHGSLDGSGFRSVALAHRESVFIGHKETPREGFSASAFSASLFDPLAFRFDRDSMTLFGAELDAIAAALGGSRRFLSELWFLGVILILIAGYSLASALLGAAPAGVSLILWGVLFTWIGLRPVYGLSSQIGEN